MAQINGNANEDARFDLKDEPIENLRRMKVRVIGAGYSGILAAIRSILCCPTSNGLAWTNSVGRIPERLRNIDLVVYEKNEGVGGVW